MVGNIKYIQDTAGKLCLYYVERRSQSKTRTRLHVYKDAKLIVKWDLDNGKAMKGKATKRVLELIRQLQIEGLL
jgi:hypothetical protein